MPKLSIFHLLVELMYEGNSGLLDELRKYEPFDTEWLLGELVKESGQKNGNNITKWIDWYVHQSVYGSEDDRNNLRSMYEFKAKSDQIRIRLN